MRDDEATTRKLDAWTVKPFAALSAAELYAIMALRQEVFVVEQSCAYLDADGLDARALHLWWAGEGGAIMAYARLFGPEVKFAERAIGRIVTAPAARGIGLGRRLVTRGLVEIEARFGPGPVRISAQKYLERFYASFGFVRASEEYLEDGIPHIEMRKD